MKHVHDFYKNREVLVTGGAGFIGSHLTEALVEAGARVTVLDNFSSGTIENLRSVLHKVTVLPYDITSFHRCLRATIGKSHIFHCAALVSVQQSWQAQSVCEYVNVTGTHNLLETAMLNGVRHVIFSSSSAVYGNQTVKCHEQMIPSPQSPYAKSKLQGEELCARYAREFNLHTVALRYFNAYGSRQNPQGDYAAVVAKFTHNLLKGLPLAVFGDGLQIRDFIPVNEVVRANLLVGMDNTMAGDIFNIASGKSITLLELIKQLEESTGRVAQDIAFFPARNGDIKYSAADCTKYQNWLSSFTKDAVDALSFEIQQPETKFFEPRP